MSSSPSPLALLDILWYSHRVKKRGQVTDRMSSTVFADVDRIPELATTYSEDVEPKDYQGYLSVLAFAYLRHKHYQEAAPVIPHRAFSDAGEVHRILPLASSRADEDMKKHYCSWMEPYLDFATYLLTHTDMPKRAGYPSVPSVLIITESYADYTVFSGSGEGRHIRDGYSFSGLRKFMGINTIGRLLDVYGKPPSKEYSSAKEIASSKAELEEAYLWAYQTFAKMQGSEYLSNVQKSTWNRYKAMILCANTLLEDEKKKDEHIFSELSFLESIFIDRGTGIHYLSNMPRNDDYLIKLYLEAAKKFFDIVIISPTVETLIPRHLISHAYGIDPSDRGKYEEFTYLSLAVSMPDAVQQYQQSANDRSTLVLVQPGMEGEQAVENIGLLSRDFASALLGEHSYSSSVLRFASAPDRATSRAVTNMNEYGNITTGKVITPFMYGSVVTGIALFAAIAELSGMAQDIVMGLSPIPALVTGVISSRKGFNRFALKKYLKNEARLNNQVFNNIITAKGFFSFHRIPTYDSAVAKAYGQLMYPKAIQRVQISNNSPVAVTTVKTFDSDDLHQERKNTQRLLPWDVLVKRAADLTSAWMSYELDPMKSLDFPLMLDPSCKETADFIRAMREMESWKEQGEDNRVEFAHALQDAEDAFAVAETNARKSRLIHLSVDQKKQVKKARTLVSIAKDEKASPNERRLALEQANQALEGVLPPLDPKVIGLLEG